MSTAVHRSPNNLWRSNSIFNQWAVLFSGKCMVHPVKQQVVEKHTDKEHTRLKEHVVGPFTWDKESRWWNSSGAGGGVVRYTVRKMGLILHSIEGMLKMQFSMARKFTLQPLRRYDIKPPEKTAQA
jgi:hypothetical protein